MDAHELDKTIDFLDHLGQEFFLHFENFKEAQKDTANMVLGGACDHHLSEAIKCKMIFEKEIENLQKLKFPFLGKSALKARVKDVVSHSLKNQFQMQRAISSVDKTFVDGAITKWLMDSVRKENS